MEKETEQSWQLFSVWSGIFLGWGGRGVNKHRGGKNVLCLVFCFVLLYDIWLG